MVFGVFQGTNCYIFACFHFIHTIVAIVIVTSKKALNIVFCQISFLNLKSQPNGSKCYGFMTPGRLIICDGVIDLKKSHRHIIIPGICEVRYKDFYHTECDFFYFPPMSVVQCIQLLLGGKMLRNLC